MGDTTEIEWCDHTFNPWIGCMRVSPLCDNCYAATMADTRFGWAEWGGPGTGIGTRTRTSEANWKKVRTWDRKAAASGQRPFVFCASLADVFDNAVEPQWRADLFDLIRQTPTRGIIRNPNYGGDYDVYVYSGRQAEKLERRFRGIGLVDVSLVPEPDAGIMDFSRPKKLPISQALAEQKETERKKRKAAWEREKRAAKALAAGREPGIPGRPRPNPGSWP